MTNQQVLTADVEKTLGSLLKDHQKYHSSLQMDSFITTRAGSYHPYGMYVQCLRELNGRYFSLREGYIREEELDIQLAQLKHEAARRRLTRAGRSERALKQLELRRLLIAKEGHTHARTDKEREFKRFLAQALVLRERVGELTPDRRDELDRDLWVCRFKQRLAIDLIREGVPSATFYEIIPTLPDDMRAEMWKALSDTAATVKWFENLASPEAPKGVQLRLSSEHLKRLISA